MYIIISALLKPLVFFYLLAIACWIFYLLKCKKWFRVFLYSAILWFIVISTPFIPDLLVAKLESKAKTSDTLPPPAGINGIDIMVLGGGHVNDFSLSPRNQLSKNALCRLVEGIRLYKKYPGSKLILSGWAQKQTLTQAQTLALTALDMGIPAKDLVLFNQPQNTSQEAKSYAEYATPGTPLIVVTDAVHIPRTLKLFSNNGFYPYISPCNYTFKQNNNKSFSYYLPSSGNIAKSELAMHEYIGILVSYFE